MTHQTTNERQTMKKIQTIGFTISLALLTGCVTTQTSSTETDPLSISQRGVATSSNTVLSGHLCVYTQQSFYQSMCLALASSATDSDQALIKSALPSALIIFDSACQYNLPPSDLTTNAFFSVIPVGANSPVIYPYRYGMFGINKKTPSFVIDYNAK